VFIVRRGIELVGRISLFAGRAVWDFLHPPFEGGQIKRQIAEVGARSLPLVVASGLALGAVMTFHTRSTLVMFGATALIPAVQSAGFLVEIGPLVTALLVAGRAGSGIGAVLAHMRATEQVDALESLSVDSFKFLVVPRVVACVIAMPILTLFMDLSGLFGGFFAEYGASRISFYLYAIRAFSHLGWVNFVPPTIKTSVFGLIVGTVSSFFGFTTNEGVQGVGRASTNSVVVSSLLIIVADVILIKCIFFVFPDGAL
jgi:phospholipid/cholesterol/gamma-HCH transport system permease protein